MGRNDPIMRAREPAEPPTWFERYLLLPLVLFWTAIAIEGVIETVEWIVG